MVHVGSLVQQGSGSMTLRKTFVGTVALFALTSVGQAADMRPVLKAPAVDQQATGYVEVYSGWASTKTTIEGYSTSADGWALGGAGRGNYWVSPGMSVQVDAQAEGTSYDDKRGGHVSSQSYLVGSHLSWRNPQQSLYGVFGGVGDAGGQRHGVIGGEAQWYLNQFTLYGQVGYDSTLGTVGYIGMANIDSENAWFLRGVGRYYVNPNFLIEGTVMYANGSVDYIRGPSLDFQTWTWGVKGEWRL